ncbi:hypothetical protein EV424DRAFT_1540689 [Suillus variegatus]|nr:hypothetical protein EV424DRAFT_1540689 [Suillus variegatus]
MAAATHTDAQARIQEELNDFVGLPTFADQLPQVTTFMLESLRWRPTSLGGMFYLSCDDTVLNDHLALQALRISYALLENVTLTLWAFCLSENPAVKIDTLAFSDTANIHAAPLEICFMKRIDENVIRELCALGK